MLLSDISSKRESDSSLSIPLLMNLEALCIPSAHTGLGDAELLFRSMVNHSSEIGALLFH